MIYTLTINPAIDYHMALIELTRGTVNRSAAEEIYLGGKGINVSTVLSTLGTENVAMGFVAGFTGEELENGLKAKGIKTDFVRLDKGMTRICVKLTDEDGTETELNAAGPEISDSDIVSLFDKLDKLTENDTLVLAGSVPKSVDSDIYEKICSRLFEKVKIAVDASGELLTKVLHFHPWLVKPNNHEAEEICGKKIDSHKSAEDCAVQLRAMGAMNVIISMGEKGAVLAAQDGNVYRITAPRLKVINSVGSGDSLLAGFLSGYELTSDYREALRYGIAAGSATAFSKGLCNRGLFEDLLSMVQYG